MEIVKPERIRTLHPFCNTEGIVAARHTPHDRHVDPAGVTFALAAGARQRGAEIRVDRRAKMTPYAG